MEKYDYLVIGSGFFGSTFAHEVKKNGKSVLVLEERNHIGGNCYTEEKDGIHIHKYGAHIFHTFNNYVWDFVNQFAKFNNYTNRVKANYNSEIYSLPINLMTLNKFFGSITPGEAKKHLSAHQIKIDKPSNFEEFALSQIGEEIYKKLIYGYTKKQWGKEPKELPIDIMKRMIIRFDYNDNYFNDAFQGIPVGGYTKIFNGLLKDINVQLNTKFHLNDWVDFKGTIIYSGKIDELFNYKYGLLEYRSLRFEEEEHIGDYQGNAVFNFTDEEAPYTRIIEHKHFEFLNTSKTIITKEYPDNYDIDKNAYYPIIDDKNNNLYQIYKKELDNYPNIIVGGRLGEYKYYNMDEAINQALNLANKII